MLDSISALPGSSSRIRVLPLTGTSCNKTNSQWMLDMIIILLLSLVVSATMAERTWPATVRCGMDFSCSSPFDPLGEAVRLRTDYSGWNSYVFSLIYRLYIQLPVKLLVLCHRGDVRCVTECWNLLTFNTLYISATMASRPFNRCFGCHKVDKSCWLWC